MFARITAHSLRRAGSILLLASVLSACSAVQSIDTPAENGASAVAQASAAPSASASAAAIAASSTQASVAPSAAESPVANTTDEQAIIASIQETLDLYAKAYNDNDPSLLAQVVDPKNGPMKRYVQTRFENYQESIFGGQGGFEYTVTEVEPHESGFIIATIERSGLQAKWTFREVNGRWLMSEPNEKQLGERQKVESEHFTFYMYPWTKDVNEKLMQQMDVAREQVLEKLGKVPDLKANVYIKPTFGVGAVTSPNTLAFYDRNSRAGDRIVIAAPNSYVFPFYDASAGWEGDLQTTLTHEYTHLVNNRSFTPISRMSDWMVEGLAEYVSDPTSARSRGVPAAVASDQIIPIMDTSGQVNKQDLEHLTILEQDVGLAYGFAFTLVEFINDKHGGMDGFWKLVQSYDQKQNLPAAIQEAYGISYEQFDQEWRAWLEENYG